MATKKKVASKKTRKAISHLPATDGRNKNRKKVVKKTTTAKTTTAKTTKPSPEAKKLLDLLAVETDQYQKQLLRRKLRTKCNWHGGLRALNK